MSTLDTSNIAILLSAGADAMDNLFEVSFVVPSSWGISDSDCKQLKLRTENFTPPAPKRPTVNIPYQSITIQKPGSTIDLQRQLSLLIRLDAGFTTYKVLSTIKEKSFKCNSESSIIFNSPSEELTLNVVAFAYDFPDKESEVLHTWIFHDVVLTGLSITEYSNDNQASPTKATVELTYSYYEEA